MLSHEQIWNAIDKLADRKGLSPSGLARRAGLDPTTFNPSKRVAGDGRPRWPSTESLAKILAATGEPLTSFVAGMEEGTGTSGHRPDNTASMPLADLAKAGSTGFFDADGRPRGPGWDEIHLPDTGNAGHYALEVTGDGLLPQYGDGDILIVAPKAAVRRGDKIVLRTATGTLLMRHLHRRTANTVELCAFGDDVPNEIFNVSEIEWIARIIWASQ